MEITTDIQLKGSKWIETIDLLENIFKPRTNYDVFMLSLSIGVMYDQRIATSDMPVDELRNVPKNVPRNVLQNHDNGRLDYIFQAAILSTSTEDLTEDQRLELAFGDESQYNKIGFLTEFANFGVTKLSEYVTQDPIETMENLKNFATSSVEGSNYDIDSLPDDILLLDEEA